MMAMKYNLYALRRLAKTVAPTLSRLLSDQQLAYLASESMAFRSGRLQPDTSLEVLPFGDHGWTWLEGTRTKATIINALDPDWRQEEAYLHERIHQTLIEHDTSTGPIHREVSALAKGIRQMREMVLTDREQTLIDDIQRLRGARRMAGLRPRPGSDLLRAPQNKVAVARRPRDEAAEAAILAKYQGWATPHLIQMFYANSLVWGLAGVDYAFPIHDINGWRADNLASWFEQLISTLDSGATRHSMTYGRTAVAGGAAATAATTTSAFGLLCVLADTLDLDNNTPFEVELFTPGQQLDYLIHPNFIEGGGHASFLAVHATNERGAGIPTRRDDLNGRTVAGQRRDGSTILVKTLNYRDIQS
jgi:hypothetical protein